MLPILLFGLLVILVPPIYSGLLSGFVGSDGMSGVLDMLDKCGGEPTGLSELANKRITSLAANCFSIPQSRKYCQYRCALKTLGAIDDSGKLNQAKVKALERELNDFEKKDEALAAMHVCLDNGKIRTCTWRNALRLSFALFMFNVYVLKGVYNEANKCKTTRTFYFCFQKSYRQICGGSQSAVKDSVEEAEETDADGNEQEETKGVLGGLIGGR